MEKHIGTVQYDSNRLSIGMLADRYDKGVLKLDPVFQRQSVWRKPQRTHLLDSIFQGYPIPAIFLYRHVDDTGKTLFEVVDGKQRLETLLMYMGRVRGKFAVPLQLAESGRPELVDWKKLCKLKQQSRVEEYLLQVVEVSADLPDIIELFVRINSTGNALTRQEIRNAKFYRSEFLKIAKRLASRYEPYFQNTGIIGALQARRMKHIELLSELTYAAHIGGVANKKRVLDVAMRHDGLVGAALRKSEKATVAGLNRLRRMFPELSKSVRFHKISDFYSLAVAIQGLEQRGFVLDNAKRNRLAWDLLASLSTGVDDLASKSKKLELKSLSPREELFRQYLQAVREGSDSEANRRNGARRVLERGWVDDRQNLTTYRNIIPDGDLSLVVLLIGVDRVTDSSSMEDFHHCDLRAIWEDELCESFADWTRARLELAHVAHEEDTIERFDSILKPIVDRGLCDVLQVSSLLEELDLSAAQVGRDAEEALLAGLGTLGLPDFSSFRFSSAKAFGAYLDSALGFFSYDDYLKKLDRDNAIRAVETFQKQNASGEGLDPNSRRPFATDTELFDNLKRYVETADATCRTRLLGCDFVIIRDEILSSRSPKDPDKPKQKPESVSKLSGGPIEVVLSALWTSLGEFKRAARECGVFAHEALTAIRIESVLFKHDADGASASERTANAIGYLKRLLVLLCYKHDILKMF